MKNQKVTRLTKKHDEIKLFYYITLNNKTIFIKPALHEQLLLSSKLLPTFSLYLCTRKTGAKIIWGSYINNWIELKKLENDPKKWA